MVSHRADQERIELGERGVTGLATLGGRLLARFVDTVIFGVPYLLVALAVLHLSALLTLVGFGLLAGVYEAVVVALWQVTPGKLVARLRVVDLRTGEAPPTGRAVRRAITLCGPLVLPGVGLLVVLGYALVALLDERAWRGPHDRVAGTVVVTAR